MLTKLLITTLIGLFHLVIESSGATLAASSDPSIIYWKKTTGYGAGKGASFINNIYKIQYSTNYVYVSGNSIPAYSIGPWTANPNNASAQGFTFKIPRTPTVASTKTATPMGHFGVWIDGVTMYNPSDGYSYKSLGVWNRNAYYWEYVSFDSCSGHPDGSSEYHIHCNPKCLYTASSTSHSPLIGFAFDGYPIYGPYGYSSANNSASSIKLLQTSYKTRSITARTSLSNGTVLSSTYYGPTINSTYPLGSYIEDYEYSSGYGDLDQYNGRYGKTPEYPSGTYAYFVAVNSSFVPQYPFIVGPKYYGVPVSSNSGPNSGKTTITETTTTYYSYY